MALHSFGESEKKVMLGINVGVIRTRFHRLKRAGKVKLDGGK